MSKVSSNVLWSAYLLQSSTVEGNPFRHQIRPVRRSGFSGNHFAIFIVLRGDKLSLFLYQIGPCILQSSSIETLHKDFQFEHGIEMKTFLHSYSLLLRYKEILLMQTQHFRKIQQNFCVGSFGNLVAFNFPHSTKSTMITLSTLL